MSEKTKKPFKMPHTFVIIFTIILAAVALTWIIPAGQYVRFENAPENRGYRSKPV